MVENEIQIFKVSGTYVLQHQYRSFTKYIRALKAEHAKEIAISEITSTRVYRRKVHFTEIKPVSLEECPDLFVHALSEM